MKTTFADIKKSRIPAALGTGCDYARLAAYINEAQQRLLPKGLWHGSYGRFKVCVTSGCLTLPPQLAAIERIAVCGQPIPVHDLWYEFLDNGYGTRNASTDSSGASCGCSSSCGMNECILRGWYPSFDDVRGTGKKLKLVCDLSTDIGKRVLLLGYDQNNNWIRTIQNGVYSDGEIVLLAQAGGTLSTHLFDGRMTGIQFLDNRDGQVWLYEYDTVALTQRLIGSYQYWEANPNYARYFIPMILSTTQVQGQPCVQTTVELVGRLDFVPVKQDTDYLVITNIPALKEMCIGIKKAEDEADSTKANSIIAAAEGLALHELDFELDMFLGVGREVGVNYRNSSVITGSPIATLI